MKLIKPSFEIWDQEEGLEGVYKQIERAGRVCYKSEDKIAEGTAEAFTNRMVASGHGAMLEHGTIYLYLPPESPVTGYKYRDNKFSEFVEIREAEEPSPILHRFITTNLRVLVENNWLYDLKYLCKPTEYHEKRVTVKFTTQIAITREYNRHRVDSMAEQSTRYCNYGKDKFGGVNINVPDFVSAYDFDDYTLSKEWMFDTLKVLQSHEETLNAIDYWLLANHMSEYCYLQMIKLGKLAQEARTVLPLDTNSELIHTAFVKDWKHFFDLRDADSAHPDAKGLARPLHQEFIKRGYVTV